MSQLERKGQLVVRLNVSQYVNGDPRIVVDSAYYESGDGAMNAAPAAQRTDTERLDPDEPFPGLRRAVNAYALEYHHITMGRGTCGLTRPMWRIEELVRAALAAPLTQGAAVAVTEGRA